MTKTAQVARAMLLAAGRGTRMRELTDEIPKPMIEVRGQPILLHIVEGLRAAGVTEFLIIVGYREDVIRSFFGDGSSWGIRIDYQTQVVQDGTGKVVELGRSFCGDHPFVLSYGDILVDRRNYLALTRPGEEQAIISVKKNEDVTKGGAVFVNDAFEMFDLREKPGPGEPTSPWYNAGLYMFRPSIFEWISRLEKSVRGEYELTDAIRNLALSGGKVKAYELVGEWADVRDPEILQRLNRGG